jgi:hypothetical protein
MRLDELFDSIDLVRCEVIHHHHIASRQRGAQNLFDIGQEYIPVGGFLDGHGGDDSALPHSGQNGHDLPVAAGRRFVDAAAVGAARIDARHRCRDAALVQEDQVFRRRGADFGDELLAPLAVLLAIALGGVE